MPKDDTHLKQLHLDGDPTSGLNGNATPIPKRRQDRTGKLCARVEYTCSIQTTIEGDSLEEIKQAAQREKNNICSDWFPEFDVHIHPIERQETEFEISDGKIYGKTTNG